MLFIKDMEMPRACEYCKFLTINEWNILIGTICKLTGEDVYSKPCPLVELEGMEELTDKEIPYKPIPYPSYCGKCKCDAIFLDKTTNYCGNCGQKLDWKENTN